MKWIYLAVICLGLIAATSAAVLVAGMRDRDEVQAVAEKPVTPPQSIVTAAGDLDAMTVIDGSTITMTELDPEAVPEGALRAPEQAIGRVLATQMRSGQVLTERVFISSGTGPQMAAVLSPGKRAVQLSLAPHSGLRGLLYPGSLVDVLLSAQVDDGGSGTGKRFVSVPLLQGIQILAVGRRTVLGAPSDDNTGPEERGRLLVTLRVDPKQARALQLGQEKGMLSLALRNPFDRDEVAGGPLQLQDVIHDLDRYFPDPVPPQQSPARTPSLTGPEPSTPVWTVTVIRAGNTDREDFEGGLQTQY
ncbi:MAG: Flp pilus assembly protein CpaB [Planctomycetota bacterium]